MAHQIEFNNSKNPLVSIVICTYNDALYLDKCITSVLNQTHTHFELIIVNDGSTDDTEQIVLSYNDKRIKYYKIDKNKKNISEVRRFAIKKIRGEYVFFTDSDCWFENNWLSTGLKAFAKHKCLAIEGKIIYNKRNYKPTLSDLSGVSNAVGNSWMTGNMAYKKCIFGLINFNPTFPRLSDREFALRIKKLGPICFVPSFTVYHTKKKRTIKSYLNEAKRSIYKVRLIKEQGDTTGSNWRILEPKLLLVAIFPPLILMEFAYGRIRSWEDLQLLPFVWIKSVYMRYLIWKTAINEKVFVL